MRRAIAAVIGTIGLLAAIVAGASWPATADDGERLLSPPPNRVFVPLVARGKVAVEAPTATPLPTSTPAPTNTAVPTSTPTTAPTLIPTPTGTIPYSQPPILTPAPTWPPIPTPTNTPGPQCTQFQDLRLSFGWRGRSDWTVRLNKGSYLEVKLRVYGYDESFRVEFKDSGGTEHREVNFTTSTTIYFYPPFSDQWTVIFFNPSFFGSKTAEISWKACY